MSMGILRNVSDIRDISTELLMDNGKLKLLSYEEYNKYSFPELRLFCHNHARYGLPTIELIAYLKKIIGDKKAIEIGSGHGDLGYHLGIPMTDSWIQNDPGVRSFYILGCQPVIEYPDDVEKLEALDAIEKYKPDIVIGSWITQWIDPKKALPSERGSIFGVKERKLLKRVKQYILLGNLDIHGLKKILKVKHRCIKAKFLKSRSSKPELDRLFIWENKS